MGGGEGEGLRERSSGTTTATAKLLHSDLNDRDVKINYILESPYYDGFGSIVVRNNSYGPVPPPPLYQSDRGLVGGGGRRSANGNHYHEAQNIS